MVLGIKQPQQVIIFLTRTIVQLCLESFSVKYFQDIPRSVCNRNQARQNLQIHIIYMTDWDHDYVIDEMSLQNKIEYEIYINIEDNSD